MTHNATNCFMHVEKHVIRNGRNKLNATLRPNSVFTYARERERVGAEWVSQQCHPVSRATFPAHRPHIHTFGLSNNKMGSRSVMR